MLTTSPNITTPFIQKPQQLSDSLKKRNSNLIDPSFYEISCLHGFHHTHLVTLNDLQRTFTTENKRVLVISMGHPYAKLEIPPYYSSWNTLFKNNSKSPHQNNKVLLFNTVHQHTNYETCLNEVHFLIYCVNRVFSTWLLVTSYDLHHRP